MRQCTKCKEHKTLSDFFIKNKSTGRLHTQCKTCYKLHRQSYYANHYRRYGEQYRERARMRRVTIRKSLQDHMLKYLQDKSCSLCGESDIRTLEFDHLDPATKSFGIAKGITDGKSWDSILLEIKKCRILCANCHKRHTATQGSWYKNI